MSQECGHIGPRGFPCTRVMDHGGVHSTTPTMVWTDSETPPHRGRGLPCLDCGVKPERVRIERDTDDGLVIRINTMASLDDVRKIVACLKSFLDP